MTTDLTVGSPTYTMVDVSFTFDRDYGNREQVARFYDDYLLAREAVLAEGGYPYNDSFRGLIPGIEGPDEGTAIYMLQGEYQLRELEARVAAFLADGGQGVEHLDAATKYAVVVEYGFYVGGTGWREWLEARIVPDPTGKPRAVLPKGKRTRGHRLSPEAIVLAKPLTRKGHAPTATQEVTS